MRPHFSLHCRDVPDQGSELNQGCAGLNQDSAAQMLNRGTTAEPGERSNPTSFG